LFKDILAEHIEASGLTFDKLVAATGVPERFVAAFVEGNYPPLPAAPYARGYLKKIAEVLEVDGSELWRAYERESKPRKSGGDDFLPQNRFTMRQLNKKIAGAALVSLLVLIYIGFNAKHLLGLPDLTVELPSSSITRSLDGLALIRGRISNPKDIVNINSVAVYVDEFGEFQKEFQLDPGVNNFDISVKRFLGRTKTETRQIIFEPAVVVEKDKNIKN